MDKKEQLLNETDTRLNDLGFGNLDDLDLIDNILAKEISRSELRKMKFTSTFRKLREWSGGKRSKRPG
jgi:hypothetical protein